MPLHIDSYSSSILNNISFTLATGENLIILGSNGVGKTTLAKVLCGITPSDAVTIDSINPSKLYGKSRARLINYIPPKLDVFDEFISVREFLDLGVLSPVYSIDEVLESLDILALADKACHVLSSGESQLLLIASALLHDAKYSIFDEPTANLDPQKMQVLFSLLRDADAFKSKVIITHNLDLAYKLGFDILFLEAGAVKFQGNSSAFFAQENLDILYEGAVKKQANNIVVKL